MSDVPNKMRVKDVIAVLQTFNPETFVVAADQDENDYGGFVTNVRLGRHTDFRQNGDDLTVSFVRITTTYPPPDHS